MSRLTDRGFTQAEADEFMARSSGSHTVRWFVDVFRWVGGVEQILYEDLPIVGGSLRLDASDPIRRQLTLEVGTVGELVPDQPADPLAPFGQCVRLWVKIDRSDGSWFKAIRMGEYPIQTVTSEWPSMIQTLECQDYAAIVDAYLFEKKRSFHGRTVRQAIQEIVQDALPDHEFTIMSPGAPKTVKCEPHTVAEAGSSRWETAVAIAEARGFDVFFNAGGNVIIRRSISNADNETQTITGEGPDIGTVSNPVAIIKDGPGGSLVGLTAGITREGAVNGVFINIHETVSQTIRRRRKTEKENDEIEKDPDDEEVEDVADDDPEVPKIPNPAAGDARVNVTVKALGTNAIAWGDRFGRAPIVLERNVKRINDSVVKTQKRRAKRLLHRRGGVIRSIDLEAVGLYWLEPDDKIRVKYAGRTEAHYCGAIEFDLSGESPAHVTTRALNVLDPG